MSTPAFAHAPDAPAVPGTPWRAVVLLTVVVALVHLVLLGAAPLWPGAAPSPPASRFITRTIVVAPPEEKAAPPPAPVQQQPAARPMRQRQAAQPKPPAAEVHAAEPAPAAASPEPAAESDAAAESPSVAATGAANGNADAAAAPVPIEEAPVPTRIPGSVQLNFDGTASRGATPYKGYGELVWLQDGNEYDARMTLKAFWITFRTQHSKGNIGPTGIEPTRFADKRKSEVASHFVRDQQQVVFSNNAPAVPLLPGAQDRVTVVMQLGALMAGDPARYPPGGAIALQTVGPRDADIWIFKIEDDERVNVLAGEFVARKLTRNPRKPFDDKLELWLAPELGYLPVRIRQTESNGDDIDLHLRNLAPVRQ